MSGLAALAMTGRKVAVSVSADSEYTQFVAARLPALRRLAFHLCGDAHQADDLVQETVTKLYVRWPLRAVDNIDGYVRTMLVRAFIDERRRGWWRIRLFAGVGDEPTLAAETTPAVTSRVDEHTALQSALAKVPRRQQAVLVLRFLHDIPVTEVAVILDCSTGTVKSQTSRGLAAMRKLLSDHSDTTGPGPTTGALR
jgi:RNA polymerase sigma-70 factor (sigma-E family)